MGRGLDFHAREVCQFDKCFRHMVEASFDEESDIPMATGLVVVVIEALPVFVYEGVGLVIGESSAPHLDPTWGDGDSSASPFYNENSRLMKSCLNNLGVGEVERFVYIAPIERYVSKGCVG